MLRHGLLVVAAIHIALTANPATAAEDRATGGGSVAIIEVVVDERKSKGQLDACELTYTVAFEDNIYRKGEVTALRGSVSIAGFIEAKDKPPAIIFKVTAFDMVNNKPQFAPLDYAYISAAGHSTAGKEYVKFTCEDGGICLGVDMLQNPELGMAIGQDFQIGITRANGRSDVVILIAFMREHAKQALAFSECTLKLLDAIQKKFTE